MSADSNAPDALIVKRLAGRLSAGMERATRDARKRRAEVGCFASYLRAMRTPGGRQLRPASLLAMPSAHALSDPSGGGSRGGRSS